MGGLPRREATRRSIAARPQAGRPTAITISRVPIDGSVSGMRHCLLGSDRGRWLFAKCRDQLTYFRSDGIRVWMLWPESTVFGSEKLLRALVVQG